MNVLKLNRVGLTVKKLISFIIAKAQVVLAVAILSFTIVAILALSKSVQQAETITWKLDNPGLVGGYKPVILGNPLSSRDTSGTSLSFNGVNDGLVIPKIPIEGWKRFTIEVLFKPDASGPRAPRFVHFQDKQANRGTIEIRLAANKRWYLDTFLKNGATGTSDRGLTLIDSTLQHPADQWYWAALVYDGKRMTSYVNGVKELEGDTNFTTVTSGEISLGVRLNKVNWFKGLIREIRFHPAALDQSALRQP
jgi:hypothetical protein